MHYIIGPDRSAEAMARKFGLREEEWRPIAAAADVIVAPVFDEHNRFLVTHDAWQLGDYNEIMGRVREQEAFESQPDISGMLEAYE